MWRLSVLLCFRSAGSGDEDGREGKIREGEGRWEVNDKRYDSVVHPATDLCGAYTGRLAKVSIGMHAARPFGLNETWCAIEQMHVTQLGRSALRRSVF